MKKHEKHAKNCLPNLCYSKDTVKYMNKKGTYKKIFTGHTGDMLCDSRCMELPLTDKNTNNTTLKIGKRFK